MNDQILHYRTELTPNECIERIMALPWEYECKWGTPLWYKAEKPSDSVLHITFTGGQFRKMMHTQYWMRFVPEGDTTMVILQFCRETFGLPPLTPPSDIDLFMQQKINAARQ